MRPLLNGAIFVGIAQCFDGILLSTHKNILGTLDGYESSNDRAGRRARRGKFPGKYACACASGQLFMPQGWHMSLKSQAADFKSISAKLLKNRQKKC